jgi:hypothetical protein
MKLNTTNTIVLVLLGLLTGSTLAQDPKHLSTVSWDSSVTGEILGAIWKVSIIICLILLVVDAVQRFQGKRLGIFHSVRFIWFIYGTAGAAFAGSHVTNGYRGFNSGIFSEFFLEIFDGYFGSGYMGIFNNTMKFVATGGVEEPVNIKEMLLQNTIFWELLIFIGLRIGALVLQKGLATGNPLSNLLGTLRRVFGWFFGLYFWQFGFQWFQNLHSLAKQAKAAEGVELTGRAHFNIWLNWLLAFYVIGEVLFMIFEALFHAFKAGSTKSREGNYLESVNPAGGNNNQNSYDASIDEVAFMFQKKDVALQSPLTQYYNPLWMFRWAAYLFIAFTFWNKVRSVYILFLIGNVISVAWTVIALKSFNKPAGIMILVSEVFILLRHLSHLAHFGSQFGDNEMSQFWTDFWTHIAFWAYLFGTLIEFGLLFEPLYSDNKAANNEGPKEKTPSQELDDLEIGQEDDLENRINTYKTMRSKKNVEAPKDEEAPAQDNNAEAEGETPAQDNNAEADGEAPAQDNNAEAEAPAQNNEAEVEVKVAA